MQLDDIEVSIPCDDVTLDGRLRLPISPRAGVVLCHPHPAFGGNMDNGLIVTLAQALSQKGYATLRFDFRGIRRSTGQATGGDREGEDVLAAAAYLRSRGVEPLCVAGYSFGAAVALESVWRGADFAAVACIGFPTQVVAPGSKEEARVRETISQARNLLFISGTQDPYSTPGILEAWGGRVEQLMATAHFYSTAEERQILALVERLFLAGTTRPA
jgi:alpha/beta superfamily hydrolase